MSGMVRSADETVEASQHQRFPPWVIVDGTVRIEPHRAVVLSAITAVNVEDVADHCFASTDIDPMWTVEIEYGGRTTPCVYSSKFGPYESADVAEALQASDHLIRLIRATQRP